MFNNLFKYENNLTVSGLNESLINEFIVNYYLTNKKDVLVVSDSLYEANKIYKGIHKILSDVYFFPMDECATAFSLSSSPDLKIIRIDTLGQQRSSMKQLSKMHCSVTRQVSRCLLLLQQFRIRR